MSLENLLGANTEALLMLNATMREVLGQAQANIGEMKRSAAASVPQLTTEAPATKEPRKARTTLKAAAPAPQPEENDTIPTPDFEDVRTISRKLIDAKGKPVVIELLKKFGVVNINDLVDKQFIPYIETAQGILDGEATDDTKAEDDLGVE